MMKHKATAAAAEPERAELDPELQHHVMRVEADDVGAVGRRWAAVRPRSGRRRLKLASKPWPSQGRSKPRCSKALQMVSRCSACSSRSSWRASGGRARVRIEPVQGAETISTARPTPVTPSARRGATMRQGEERRSEPQRRSPARRNARPRCRWRPRPPEPPASAKRRCGQAHGDGGPEQQQRRHGAALEVPGLAARPHQGMQRHAGDDVRRGSAAPATDDAGRRASARRRAPRDERPGGREAEQEDEFRQALDEAAGA